MRHFSGWLRLSFATIFCHVIKYRLYEFYSVHGTYNRNSKALSNTSKMLISLHATATINREMSKRAYTVPEHPNELPWKIAIPPETAVQILSTQS